MYVIKELGECKISLRTGQILDKSQVDAETLKYELRLNELRRSLESVRQEIAKVNAAWEEDLTAQLKRLEELQRKETVVSAELGLESKQPWVVNRPCKGIIFYSGGGYFEYFYGRHAGRSIGAGTASVLVMPDGSIPPKPIVFELLKRSMFKATLVAGFTRSDVPTPQDVVAGIGVRTWDFDRGEFITSMTQGAVALREIWRPKSFDEFYRLVKEEKLTEREVNEVAEFVKISRKPPYPYAVKYVIFVDKYFVAQRVQSR